MKSRLRRLQVDGQAFTWKAGIVPGPRRIRVRALANGWVPATRGGTYLLTPVSQVTLPDFTLVQP
jgi:hypothetical protein